VLGAGLKREHSTARCWTLIFGALPVLTIARLFLNEWKGRKDKAIGWVAGQVFDRLKELFM
jgi:hypothetical protein